MLHDPSAPHPFSRFVAILGRGKTKQRHLTFEESREGDADDPGRPGSARTDRRRPDAAAP